MLDLVLLGTGGGMPVPFRFLSSLLIQYKGRKILVDCGEGTQVSLKMVGWGLKSIDVICLTHFHGDHFYGLFGLLSTIGNSGRTESIAIIGPKGLETIIELVKQMIPYLPFELIPYESPGNFSFLEINIKTLELFHSAPCLGYSFYLSRQPQFDVQKAIQNQVPKRIWNHLQKGESREGFTPDMVLGNVRPGIKIAFITDTRPIPEIIPFIQQADLLICEGTYGSDSESEKAIQNFHMTFKEALLLGLAGEVKEMWLTHFSPSLKEPVHDLEQINTLFPNASIGVEHLKKTLNFR